MLTRSFVKYNVFLVILLLPFLSLKAQTPNERQARRIFNHTYDMVFGDKGSSLSYNVNIPKGADFVNPFIESSQLLVLAL